MSYIENAFTRPDKHADIFRVRMVDPRPDVAVIVHRDEGMRVSYSVTITMEGKPCYGAGGFASETLAAHAAWKAACARGWKVTSRKTGKRVKC